MYPRAVAARPEEVLMNDMTDMSKISARAICSQDGSEPVGLFVPMDDELLYDHPERISGPLIAYQPGHICATWLSVELNPTDEPPIKRTRRETPADAGETRDTSVTDAA